MYPYSCCLQCSFPSPNENNQRLPCKTEEDSGHLPSWVIVCPEAEDLRGNDRCRKL